MTTGIRFALFEIKFTRLFNDSNLNQDFPIAPKKWTLIPDLYFISLESVCSFVKGFRWTCNFVGFLYDRTPKHPRPARWFCFLACWWSAIVALMLPRSNLIGEHYLKLRQESQGTDREFGMPCSLSHDYFNASRGPIISGFFIARQYCQSRVCNKASMWHNHDSPGPVIQRLNNIVIG